VKKSVNAKVAGNLRLGRWLLAAKKLSPLEIWVSFVVASLGRLDCSIIGLDGQIASGRQPLPRGGYSYDTSDSVSLSYFWVLGAYELVRVLNQRVRERDPFCTKHFPRVKTLKLRFERIRIPLAKLEPSRRNKATDFRIAVPVFNSESKSTDWIVAQNVAISRRELADELLDFLTRSAR
jgi:hypothetical protein